MSARFLVAKYVRDTKRMEPRNIGVVVWNNGCAQSRFLGEDGVIPRQVGVRDKGTYRKWLAAWKMQLAKPFLEFGHGQVAMKSAPEFLDALLEWSRGNFLLVEGGMISEKVRDNETDELTQYLFRQLVAEDDATEEKEHEYARLKTQVAHLIKATGANNRDDWREAGPMWYRAYEVLKYFQIDYTLGPIESPHSIYNRVLLGNQRQFDATAFHLDWFRRSRDYAKEQVAAFVVSPKTPTSEQKGNRELLGCIATVIDVADENSAIQEFKRTMAITRENATPQSDPASKPA